MPESEVLNLNYLGAELTQMGILLQRPVVQIQLLALVVVIVLAWLISKWSWVQLKRRSLTLSQFQTAQLRLSWRQYGASLLYYLLTPTLSLVAVNLLKLGFEQWGWFTGYLSAGIEILGYFWFYRLFLLSLYALFPANSVTYYLRLFFNPLFYLLLTGGILSWFLDLGTLSQVTFIHLFGASVTLGSAFVMVAGLYFWILGTMLLEKLSLHLLFRRNSQDSRVAPVIALLLRYFLIGLGIVLIFGFVGVNPTALAAITGGLSVGIGFGLKEVISNFVSGIWLLFEGALKPGDIVIIDGKWSKVTKLGIRATTVQVFQDNSEEIIPNQTFFTQNISTLTGSDRFVVGSLIVGASYQCNPTQVIEILLQVAHQHPQVLETPPPKAFARGFGDSSIDFNLKFWISDPLTLKPITTQLVCDIWQAFADNNIEIPYPQRDLHIRSVSQDLES